MLSFPIDEVIARLESAADSWETPAVTVVSRREGDPYKVLVSCILSLRTKDTTTGPAAERLFRLAGTAEEMCLMSPGKVEAAIYPVGFYRTKALQIIDISREIVELHQGRTPDNIDELLKFKGVGRKTANLVVTLGFGLPGICVDTHVHRICNRWGYVETATPEETESRLRQILPRNYWLRINDLLVAFGQNLCRPVSPICSSCPIYQYCMRCNVIKKR